MIREKLRDENRRNFANEAARMLGIPASYERTNRDRVDARSVRPLGAWAARSTSVSLSYIYSSVCLFRDSIPNGISLKILFYHSKIV